MKKVIFLMMVTMSSILCDGNARPKVSATLTVEIARPKKDCKFGLWFCNPKVDIDVQMIGRTATATFSDNGDGTMTIDFLTKLPETTTAFYADANEIVILPANICKIFGYTAMAIIPGTYVIRTSTIGRFGSVRVKIKTS